MSKERRGEGGRGGAYEALAEYWKNRPTKNKKQAEDKDMGLFGEKKRKK